jgi:phospholipid/cholesterol/gamma-HCH transport system substrate-binding protein
MARKTSKFTVGLFVIVGFIIAAVAIIWIGATQYFQKGDVYVTYFDESVQGLQKDSEVKYRGVTVGRVEEIRIAPDNRLVSVIMSIDLKEDTARNLVAQLQLTGITGLMFVNLNVREPEDEKYFPKIDFASEHPIIPSKPSDIKRLFTSAEIIVENIKELDFKAISDKMQATVQAIQKFVESKELKNIMANTEATTARMKNLSGELDKLVAEGNVKKALTETLAALKSAQDVFGTLNAELKATEFPKIGSKTRSLLADMEATTQKLKKTTENLERLSERLEYQPSDLIFGKPPKPRWNEK